MSMPEVTVIGSFNPIPSSSLKVVDVLQIFGFPERRATELSRHLRIRDGEIQWYHIPALTVYLLETGELALYGVRDSERPLQVMAARDMETETIHVVSVSWGRRKVERIIRIPPMRLAFSYWEAYTGKVERETDMVRGIASVRALHQMEEHILNQWLVHSRRGGLILDVPPGVQELIEDMYIQGQEKITVIISEMLRREFQEEGWEELVEDDDPEKTPLSGMGYLGRWFSDSRSSALYYVILFTRAITELSRHGLITSLFSYRGSPGRSILSEILDDARRGWEEVTGEKLTPDA